MGGASGVLSLTGSTVNGNTASGAGGGIFDASTDAFTATGSQVKNNNATGNGGGADLNSQFAITIDNTTFSGNNALGGSLGGGLDAEFGLLNAPTVPTITIRNNSTFSHNTAGSGGGVEANSANVVITGNSTFSDNSATSNSGGVDNPGPISVTDSSFLRNTAIQGGAIDELFLHTTTILRSTFDHNLANGVDGGAISGDSGTTLVTNSTFTNNTATTVRRRYLWKSHDRRRQQVRLE